MPAEIGGVAHAIDVGVKVGAGKKVRVCGGGQVQSDGHVSVVAVADCLSTRESLLPRCPVFHISLELYCYLHSFLFDVCCDYKSNIDDIIAAA